MRVFMAFLVFFLNILEALVRSSVRPAPPRPPQYLDPEQQVAQLELVRRRRGYQPGWLYYRCRELGLDDTLRELRASGALPEHRQRA